MGKKLTSDQKIERAYKVKTEYLKDRNNGIKKTIWYYRSKFSSHCPFALITEYLETYMKAEDFVKMYDNYLLFGKVIEKVPEEKKEESLDFDVLYDKVREFYLKREYPITIDGRTRFIMLGIATKKGILFQKAVDEALKEYIIKEANLFD